MAKLTVSDLTHEDIADIGRYTQVTWGVHQREAYLDEILEVFERIRLGVAHERKRDDIKKGLRAHRHNSHVIFFRRDSDGNVEILRILHARMDFERHF